MRRGERTVMNLITRRITETLYHKGCLIKLKPGDYERVERKSDVLKLGGSTYRIQIPKEEYLELLSSFGLSEYFIYSKIHSSHDSLFSRIPQRTIAIADIEKIEKNVNFDTVKAEGIQAILMFPIEVNRENVAVS